MISGAYYLDSVISLQSRFLATSRVSRRRPISEITLEALQIIFQVWLRSPAVGSAGADHGLL